MMRRCRGQSWTIRRPREIGPCRERPTSGRCVLIGGMFNEGLRTIGTGSVIAAWELAGRRPAHESCAGQERSEIAVFPSVSAEERWGRGTLGIKFTNL